MAVISISITESEYQIIDGIPRSVVISANIPSIIFYTLDGSTPTESSLIYSQELELPTNLLNVTLKIFATNGVDSSAIITEIYTSNVLNNTRFSHSGVDIPIGENLPSLYPFGTNPSQPEGQYTSPGDVGVTVDDPSLPEIPSAYDKDGYATAFTNYPYTVENYQILYSITDFIGQTGLGVGNLPAEVDIIPEPAPSEFSDLYSNLFDPKAFVVYQDTQLETLSEPVEINRQFFSLENSDRIRDGNNYYNSGLDAPPTTGSFLRSHYNPSDNTVTYYYLDSIANRWIISKTPYQQTSGFDGNMAGFALAPKPGSQFVYEWIPFKRRVLF